MGRLFPFGFSSQRETNGRNEQKYGSGRVIGNPPLWIGTGCPTPNGDPTWGSSPVGRAIGYPRTVYQSEKTEKIH